MSIRVATVVGNGRCDAQNKSCTKEATLIANVGENTSLCLCVSCGRELFNALGFIIVSQTGESIKHLVGLTKRRRAS